jgi:dihydroorotase-like cyclic amidohydrolase
MCTLMNRIFRCRGYFSYRARGRTAWEGFETATKAAAAGGVTTLIGNVKTQSLTHVRYAAEFFTAYNYG